MHDLWQNLLPDVLVTIGLFLEPSVVTGSAGAMKIAKAKKFLLIQWMLMAFLISAAYRDGCY